MAERAEQKQPESDCLIPDAVLPEVLERYSLKQSPYDGADTIRAYLEGQSPNERVTNLEKIASKRVVSRDHETWDVHTTGERYWVITNPTNLYSQRLFPSADYTLTFHVGLTARLSSRREGRADEEQQERLLVPWRRWVQAADALDRAYEAEEFQAVAMRCRETLAAFIRDVATEDMIPRGAEAPKIGDFIHWSERIADALAAGSSAKELRSYLKNSAKSTWQLVSWLTHASNATLLDAEIALEATHSVLTAFGTAMTRFERGIPDRCTRCDSYKLNMRFLAADDEGGGAYVAVCESCGCNMMEDATA